MCGRLGFALQLGSWFSTDPEVVALTSFAVPTLAISLIGAWVTCVTGMKYEVLICPVCDGHSGSQLYGVVLGMLVCAGALVYHMCPLSLYVCAPLMEDSPRLTLSDCCASRFRCSHNCFTLASQL